MEKIARICYNDEGWLFPSGRKDKAVNKDSYEQKNGFGHEEWLLDFSKIIDGYHYGFLQPLNGYHHAGKMYDIHLFFYTKSTGKAYIGCIKNAECIDEDDAKRALDYYKKERWYNEMLVRVYSTEPVDLLKVIMMVLIHDVVEIDAGDSYAYDPEAQKSAPERERKAAEAKSELAVHGGVYERASYNPIHNKIQNSIRELLLASKDYTEVVEEKNFVDLTATHKCGEIHFFEIKTNTARLSIREALGQILEYSDYPDEARASKLIIVSVKALDESDRKYIKHLREKYDIPVWYRYYSLETESLGEEQ